MKLRKKPKTIDNKRYPRRNTEEEREEETISPNSSVTMAGIE